MNLAKRTISIPDDVVPIIETLSVPFSKWVTDQLRLHAAQTTVGFAQQLQADAALAGPEGLSPAEKKSVGARMERSAPW
jgi:hypothetical protein